MSCKKWLPALLTWPAHDRIKLARNILETVEDTAKPASRGLRGEEVIRLLQIPQPAPDDDECDQIVAEERLRKYGR